MSLLKKLGRSKLLYILNDKQFLSLKYYFYYKRKLNWEHPTLFSEKLQWIKLYYRNPLMTKLVDKYEVKEYVAKKIGAEHVVPLYKVWDSVDDIDISDLPNEFVLKATHDSGGSAICKDKSTFDLKAAKDKLKKCIDADSYYADREWPYKNVKRRIIAEKYIDSLGKRDSIEYKITCFHGKVGFVTICKGIAHAGFDDRYNNHYDVDFNQLHWYAHYKEAPDKIEKPEQWDELIRLAEILAGGGYSYCAGGFLCS